MSLLQMSCSGSIFILLIFLVRLFSINKLPKNTFLILWGLAMCRLLVPFSVPSPLSAYSFLSYSNTVQEMNSDNPISQLLPIAHETIAPQVETVKQLRVDSFPILLFVYGVGVVTVTIIFAITYFCCTRKVRTSQELTNHYILDWAQRHPLKRHVRFRQSTCISSPLTYGILSPVIMLPAKMVWDNEEALDYILLHEYQHIRRFDCLIKAVAVVSVCIHWFNPAVWLMYFFLNRDMELSCDETVVRKSGRDARARYARLLISLEEKRNDPLVLCNEFSLNVSEERIIAIMKAKRFTVAHAAMAVFIISALSIGFMTSAYGVESKGEAVLSKEIPALDTSVSSSAQQQSEPITKWMWPTTSKDISLTFGYQSQATKNIADHINIRAEDGDGVYAAIYGRVIDIGYDNEYGNYVVIESENNIKIIYGHLNNTLIAVNDTVATGERIGTVGRSGMGTGYCLSFAVFVNDQAVDPMNYYE